MPKNIREWLSWLIKLRIVVITTLLGAIVGVESAVPSAESGRELIQITVLAYGVSFLHYLFLRFNSRTTWQAYFQICCDLGLTFAVLQVTGGVESSFFFLYLLTIIMASILLYRRGAIITASVSSILVGIQYFWLVPSESFSLNSRTLWAIGIDVFAFYAVAYLSSQLSESLRRTGTELEDKTGKLANLQAIHENIINSMRGGLLTTNLEGVITLFNRSACEMTGLSEQDVLGTHVSKILGPTTWETDSAAEPLPLRFERMVKHASGSSLHFGLTVSRLLVDDNHHVGYVYAFQDLTEVRELEKQIQQRDRMAAIGRMVAAVAHEIRNPLTAISGTFHVLRSDLALNNEQRGLMDNVSLEIKRLYKIITDFLAYSKPLNFSPQRVNLGQVAAETIDLIKNSPEISPRHAIQCSSNCDQPLYCQADPDLLKQVFWNLCSNAIKAMPDGGVLTIHLENSDPEAVAIRVSDSGRTVILQVNSDPEAVAIRVSDTGRGFSEEEREKIFEPFQSSFETGTGLGLSIVSQIVAVHRGAIKVSSSRGQGASFHITLPK